MMPIRETTTRPNPALRCPTRLTIRQFEGGAFVPRHMACQITNIGYTAAGYQSNHFPKVFLGDLRK